MVLLHEARRIFLVEAARWRGGPGLEALQARFGHAGARCTGTGRTKGPTP